jgi:hypothetical protein
VLQILRGVHIQSRRREWHQPHVVGRQRAHEVAQTLIAAHRERSPVQGTRQDQRRARRGRVFPHTARHHLAAGAAPAPDQSGHVGRGQVDEIHRQ